MHPAGLGGDQRLRRWQRGLLGGDAEQAEGVLRVPEVDHLVGHAGDDLHPAVALPGLAGGVRAVTPQALGDAVAAASWLTHPASAARSAVAANTRVFRFGGTPPWIRRASSSVRNEGRHPVPGQRSCHRRIQWATSCRCAISTSASILSPDSVSIERTFPWRKVTCSPWRSAPLGRPVNVERG